MATNDLTNVAKVLKNVQDAVQYLKDHGTDLSGYLKTTDADSKYLGVAAKDEIEASAKTQAQTQIDSAIKTLVGVAPTTLDTLGEIANAIGNDANLQKTIQTAIDNKANKTNLDAHVNDSAIHLSAEQAGKIAAAATENEVAAHIADKVAHITAAERTAWNAKADKSDTTINDEVTKTWVDAQVASTGE